LEFTAEATNGATTYLQWDAIAFEGVHVDGITIFTRDADGRIASAAIRHRPRDVVLRFSTTLRDRLAGVIPPGSFLGHWVRDGEPDNCRLRAAAWRAPGMH